MNKEFSMGVMPQVANIICNPGDEVLVGDMVAAINGKVNIDGTSVMSNHLVIHHNVGDTDFSGAIAVPLDPTDITTGMAYGWWKLGAGNWKYGLGPYADGSMTKQYFYVEDSDTTAEIGIQTGNLISFFKCKEFQISSAGTIDTLFRVSHNNENGDVVIMTQHGAYMHLRDESIAVDDSIHISSTKVPSGEGHLTNKLYVDGVISNLQTKIAALEDRVNILEVQVNNK